jgi:tRNA(fMet)-specific endonuclease VapC
VTRYLLDTNIISDLIRDPAGPVAARIARVGVNAICTSIIVVAELRFGAAKKASARLTKQMEIVLRGFDIMPFEAPADDVYGQLRAKLERRGQPIGGNDLLIAAHAMAMECCIVTANEREFGRIEGLPVENWLK